MFDPSSTTVESLVQVELQDEHAEEEPNIVLEIPQEVRESIFRRLDKGNSVPITYNDSTYTVFDSAYEFEHADKGNGPRTYTTITLHCHKR